MYDTYYYDYEEEIEMELLEKYRLTAQLENDMEIVEFYFDPPDNLPISDDIIRYCEYDLGVQYAILALGVLIFIFQGIWFGYRRRQNVNIANKNLYRKTYV